MKSGEIRATAVFILVCFLFSWPLFLVVDAWLIPQLVEQGEMGTARLVITFGHYLAMCGPALAAFFMWRVYHKAGWPGWVWGKPRSYILAALAMLVLWTVPGLISLALGDSLDPSIGKEGWVMFGGGLTLLWLAGMGEEIGWCAYLLTLLTPRFGRVKAMIISGAIRGIWHLPVLLGTTIAQVMAGEKSALELLMNAIVLSLSLMVLNIMYGGVMGWLWYRTKSIPLTGWLHQWYDLTRDITTLVLVGYSQWANSLALIFPVVGLILIVRIGLEDRKAAANSSLVTNENPA